MIIMLLSCGCCIIRLLSIAQLFRCSICDLAWNYIIWLWPTTRLCAVNWHRWGKIWLFWVTCSSVVICTFYSCMAFGLLFEVSYLYFSIGDCLANVKCSSSLKPSLHFEEVWSFWDLINLLAWSLEFCLMFLLPVVK